MTALRIAKQPSLGCPRFGKTCGTEVSGALHEHQLLHCLLGKVVTDANLILFRDEMDHLLEPHRKKLAGLG
jgi:hypothetical protein